MINGNIRDELIAAACRARENAYAPYSSYKVGAALLARSGKIYSGANFENASFGAGTCAERVALGAALSAGERKFLAVACVGGEGITPCGICRQALSEFGDVFVITALPDGTVQKEFRLSELLPHAFDMKS